MTKIFLRGGKLVLPNEVRETNLLIDEGKIAFIGELDDFEGVEVVDVAGKVIFPGLIDVHVHFRTPGLEYKEDWLTGSKTALAGGVTSVFDMPNTQPATTTLEILRMKKALIQTQTLINYACYLGGTADNFSIISAAEEACGIKIYMGSSTGDLLLTADEKLEEFIRDAKLPLVFHAESEACLHEVKDSFRGEFDPAAHSQLRPAKCAQEATRKILEWAKKYNKRIHLCHVSTKLEMDLVREFGLEVATAEVTPHHLFLNDDAYGSMANFARVNPPLRSEDDRDALWQGIREGLITMIATDHAPHTLEEKRQEYLQAPSGMPGLQTTLPLLLNTVFEGRLTFLDIERLCSRVPAERFGIVGKGSIEIGNDADLVIVDPTQEQILRNDDMFTKCGWTPFDGQKVHGKVEQTFVNGVKMFDAAEKTFGDNPGKELKFRR